MKRRASNVDAKQEESKTIDESGNKRRRRESGNNKQEETPTRPEMTNEIKELLKCPISHEIMRDPVTLVQSSQTFDRESLCRCLLRNPTRCPLTNKDYGEKLNYIDNIGIRQFLTMYLGDDAYQKYDDSSFGEEFKNAAIDSGNLVEPNASTLYNLGELYWHANGVAQDYERASFIMSWRREEATLMHNSVLACFTGHMVTKQTLENLGSIMKKQPEMGMHWHSATLVFSTRMETVSIKITKKQDTTTNKQQNKAMPMHNATLVFSTRMETVSTRLRKGKTLLRTSSRTRRCRCTVQPW